VPVTNVPGVPVHHFGLTEESILNEFKNLERWMDAMVLAGNSSSKNTTIHFGSKSLGRAYIPDMDSDSKATSPNSQIDTHLVPPASVPPDNYSNEFPPTDPSGEWVFVSVFPT
jgi:hypothetical protein